MKQAAVE